MNLFSRRIINLVGFAVCGGLLSYAYYLQLNVGLEPCPLCIFQRVAMMALAAVFLVVGAHHPSRFGARIYAVLIGVAAIVGAAIAGRHVWLQHLPLDQVPECGPDLGYMLDVFPLSETLSLVFTGSGECAEIGWTFLGLSMPAWVLIWFVLLGIAGVTANWRLR